MWGRGGLSAGEGDWEALPCSAPAPTCPAHPPPTPRGLAAHGVNGWTVSASTCCGHCPPRLLPTLLLKQGCSRPRFGCQHQLLLPLGLRAQPTGPGTRRLHHVHTAGTRLLGAVVWTRGRAGRQRTDSAKSAPLLSNCYSILTILVILKYQVFKGHRSCKAL